MYHDEAGPDEISTTHTYARVGLRDAISRRPFTNRSVDLSCSPPCRRSMPRLHPCLWSAPADKLLLEMVLPERATPLIGFQLDLEILVTVGDRQRTRSDYAKLLRRMGFRLDRVVDAVTPVSIIEASPI